MIRHGAVEDGLSRKSKPEITPLSGHDPDTTHDIVIDLTAAAIDLVINRRKVVLHIDPLGDHEGGCHDGFQDFPRGILPVVIRMKKRATFEIQTLGQGATADDDQTVF